jgi:hypothetical protein
MTSSPERKHFWAGWMVWADERSINLPDWGGQAGLRLVFSPKYIENILLRSVFFIAKLKLIFLWSDHLFMRFFKKNKQTRYV